MHISRATWVISFGILVAIGCGSGTPQDVSAKTQEPATQAAQTSPPPSATAQGAPTGSSTVTGSVKFAGTAPSPEKVKMDADPQCALQHQSPVTKQDVVVNSNGTLQHVFVYVKEGLQGPFPTPSAPVKLDQHGCMYSPHVLGVQVNQPIEIINSDATLHNVNCKPTKSKPFNMAQPMKGMKSNKAFTAEEIMVKCACNVHPWMTAYIGVLSHPYYSVTGQDGAFNLAGLPAGTYTVEAWHEKFGTQTQHVSVADGESKTVNFEFTGQ